MATLTPAQSQSISKQIAQIQSGINQVAASKGVSLQQNPSGGYTAVPISKSSGGVGAVNAQGQLIGAGGQVIGMANPADRYSPSARQPVDEVAPEIVAQQSPETLQPEASKYTVQPGDTLSGIAQKQGVNMGGITGFRSGDPNKIFPGEQLDLGAQYRKGLDIANQVAPGGVEGAGMGQAGVDQIMKSVAPTVEAPSAWSSVYDLSPGVDKDFLDYDAWMSPANQKQTLKEEYESLKKSLTIGGKTAEQLDMEMIDAEAVINGTEDDIRAEVTAAGGFATDSQVQALAIARNKSLIKNYDKLVSMRKSLDTQLSTTMELSMKDRELASAEFDRKMNFAFKVAEFKERAQTNARAGLNAIVTKVGYKGLLTSLGGSLYEQSLAENLLGLGAGGLQRLASLPPTEEEQLDLDIKRATLAKTLKEVSGGGGEPSPYQQERAFRTVQSVDELKIKALSNPGIFGRSAALPKWLAPDFIRSDAYRNFQTELDTLKANIAFGELQAMREASKTGGALGNVANQELLLLESTLGGLKMTQSADNFARQLDKVKASINRWHEATGGMMEEVTIIAPDGTEVIISN